MDCVVLGGYLEVPDVHQVQQGLQDVPGDSDCVWGEVRTLGRRAPPGATRTMTTLCMATPLLSLALMPFPLWGQTVAWEFIDAGTQGHLAHFFI